MGTQSAVWMPRRRPGWLVMEGSPWQISEGAESKNWITSEWICFRDYSFRLEVPRADWKRRRFSRTFSLVSHSVKPRLRTFSVSRVETPPGLVLKPWMSQGMLASVGTCRIRMPRDLRSIHFRLDRGEETDRNVCPTGESLRFFGLDFSVFVGATIFQV